jgi:hypothetical protein
LSAPPMNSARALKILCVGTGRDGTSSIAEMFQCAFDYAGSGQRVMHEYQAREFYHAFCNYRETRDLAYLNEIRQMIDECPYDCIVGNGYAPVLPLFAERWGRAATLVHIRGVNRSRCVESIKKCSIRFPLSFRYYSPSPEALAKRMAAFHFNEMTEDEWNRLSVDEKFIWYYDKTHSLISSYKSVFADYCEITTETIRDEATRRLIGRLATGKDDVLPPAKRLNAFQFDITKVPPDRCEKMQWLFGRMDLNQMAYDEIYGIKYFLEKFVAWTGYQIDGSIKQISPNDVRTAEELHAILDDAQRILSDRLMDIDALRRSLPPNERSSKPFDDDA